jgi:hypothetical protein
MVTTRKPLLSREPDSKKGLNLSPTSGNSPPCSGCLPVKRRTKVQIRIGLVVINHRRQKSKQPPEKPKPKKTFWDFVRRFLAKNWRIITLIFMVLTVFYWIYSIWSAKGKTASEPRPRYEIEQPAPSVPVRYACFIFKSPKIASSLALSSFSNSPLRPLAGEVNSSICISLTCSR